jgi:hypothetical protein
VGAEKRIHRLVGRQREWAAPEQRANWSKTHDALLLPPGIYDVYWMQDHEHPPILVAECVKVNAHEVVVMPVH